jgi:thiol-disulfide isomerase/thioredoxin
MLSYIRNNYLLTPESLTDSADLVLTSIDSENINYNKLIEKHRGNVLYVDFWSSGCSPCFEQFKFSDTLHHLYKDKNLVQIYISHEPDKRRWLNASKKYNLDPESYLVVNRYTSQQLENMNIKFVPHYLIYDQKGNLVNDFAPRPSEKSLIQILDKYLNE